MDWNYISAKTSSSPGPRWDNKLDCKCAQSTEHRVACRAWCRWGREPPCCCHRHPFEATWPFPGQTSYWRLILPPPQRLTISPAEGKSCQSRKLLRVWKTQVPGPVRMRSGERGRGTYLAHIPAQGAQTPAPTHSGAGIPTPATPVMQWDVAGCPLSHASPHSAPRSRSIAVPLGAPPPALTLPPSGPRQARCPVPLTQSPGLPGLGPSCVTQKRTREESGEIPSRPKEGC